MSFNEAKAKYASLGATCADYGTTLPKDYKQAKYPEKNYISPDRMIDASTCALPENTWFVRDWLHCNGNAGIDRLFALVMTGEAVDIRAFAEYPQFLEADEDADTVRPVTGAPDAWARLKRSPTYLNLIRFLLSALDRLGTRILRLLPARA